MLLYGNTVSNDYTLDDTIYTTENEYIINGFSSVKDIFNKGSLYGFTKDNFVQQSPYRPLTLLSFMTEASIVGFNPHISHFINILLFAITVVLLYFFLQQIMPGKELPENGYGRAIILSATLLFAFHPIHTEVVDSIKSRDEILGFLFGLISFYFIILYGKSKSKSYYIISLAAFFLGLFCKENCLTFVAIIPLLLYFFTPEEVKKIAFVSIPYFAVLAIYVLIRSRVVHGQIFTNKIPVIDNTIMAAGSIAENTATSFVILGKYMYMTFIPFPLSWDYSYNQIPVVSWGNVKAILSLLVTIILIAYMFWGFRKKSIFSFLIAFFFITIFLSSNIVIKIGSTFAERFLYVPSLSFCVSLPVLLARVVSSNKAQFEGKNKIYFYGPVALLLIVYTIIVVPRNNVWKNNLTLFSSGIITSPNSGRTHVALAGIYLDSLQNSKDSAGKLQFYHLAVKESKRSIYLAPFYSESYYNLGLCYYMEKKQDSALPAFKKGLELDPKSTRSANDIGVIYFSKAQYDTAIHYFKIAFKDDTGNTDALANIGASYQNEKKYPLAFHYDSIILKIDPGNIQTLKNLSVIYNDLGMQYVNNNKLDSALGEFVIAIHYDSNSANPIGNIGVVYQKKGDVEKAKYYYQKALSKDPDLDVFKRNMQRLNTGR